MPYKKRPQPSKKTRELRRLIANPIRRRPLRPLYDPEEIRAEIRELEEARAIGAAHRAYAASLQEPPAPLSSSPLPDGPWPIRMAFEATKELRLSVRSHFDENVGAAIFRVRGGSLPGHNTPNGLDWYWYDDLPAWVSYEEEDFDSVEGAQEGEEFANLYLAKGTVFELSQEDESSSIVAEFRQDAFSPNPLVLFADPRDDENYPYPVIGNIADSADLVVLGKRRRFKILSENLTRDRASIFIPQGTVFGEDYGYAPIGFAAFPANTLQRYMSGLEQDEDNFITSATVREPLVLTAQTDNSLMRLQLYTKEGLVAEANDRHMPRNLPLIAVFTTEGVIPTTREALEGMLQESGGEERAVDDEMQAVWQTIAEHAERERRQGGRPAWDEYESIWDNPRRQRMPNPMSPGFARFVQARNEIESADSLDDLLEAYLFHRIRHQHEEQGSFAQLLDVSAVVQAHALGMTPRKTSGMSRDDYEYETLKMLIDSGRHNRWYIVEGETIVSPIQGYPSVIDASEQLKGMQVDMFGEGPQVISARALALRYLNDSYV